MLKKIFTYVISVISALFFLSALLIIIAGTISQKNHSVLTIFGYSFSVVATDSMEPTIMVGEVIIAKTKPYEEVLQGDIIVFFSEELQEYVVHRVFEIAENGDLITKGDNPIAPIDENPVTTDNYFGTVTNHGKFLNIGNAVLKYRNIVFLLIIAVFIFIIISETITIVRQVNKKNEEQAKQKWEAEKQSRLLEEKEKVRQELLEELRTKK